jgi:hypothetical protein
MLLKVLEFLRISKKKDIIYTSNKLIFSTIYVSTNFQKSKSCHVCMREFMKCFFFSPNIAVKHTNLVHYLFNNVRDFLHMSCFWRFLSRFVVSLCVFYFVRKMKPSFHRSLFVLNWSSGSRTHTLWCMRI